MCWLTLWSVLLSKIGQSKGMETGGRNAALSRMGREDSMTSVLKEGRSAALGRGAAWKE